MKLGQLRIHQAQGGLVSLVDTMLSSWEALLLVPGIPEPDPISSPPAELQLATSRRTSRASLRAQLWLLASLDFRPWAKVAEALRFGYMAVVNIWVPLFGHVVP